MPRGSLRGKPSNAALGNQRGLPAEMTRYVLRRLLLAIPVLLGIMTAFISAYFRRTRTTPDGESFVLAWDQFKGDVSRIVPSSRRTNGSRRAVSKQP